MKRFVACYDITDNYKRTKMMKRLRGSGFHAQLSFFEIEAEDPDRVSSQLKDLLARTDRFAVIRVSKRGRIRRIGSLLEGMEWVL